MSGPPLLALVLTALVAALRLAELGLSRHWLGRPEDRAAEVLPERVYPLMVALHSGWLAGCLAEPWLRQLGGAPWPGEGAAGWLFWSAGGFWAGALALRAWMLATLGRYWNVRVVRRAGQPVITGGPYRWVRHPNYLAVIVELAAFPLLVGAPWTALAGSLANAPVLWFRIRTEEAYLFGQPGYREAFGGKKRFVPGVF